MAVLTRAYRAFTALDWSTPENAIHRDGTEASSAAAGDLVNYDSADFSAIPDDATIDGIQITLVAKKDTSSGSGTLWINVEVNDDAGWTTAGYQSANLTTTEAVLTVGGPTDLWGGTWTRSLLAPDVKLETDGTGISGTPEWRLNYVEVSVFYTDTTTIELGIQETTTAVDSMAPSRLHRGIQERAEATTDDRGPRNPILGKSGSAVEIQALAADFNAATAPHNALVAMGVVLLLKTATGLSLLQIGDDVLAQEFDLNYQEGVISWDTIAHTGAAGVEQEYSDTGIVLRNQPYTDGGNTTKTIADWCRTSYMIGSTAWIYAVAKSPTGWQQRCIFEGTISSLLIGETTVELRMTQERQERTQIPTLQLGPLLLNYGTDEGSLPREQSGTPIPLAFGRFDPSAIKAWPATSILANRNQGAYMAAVLGMKFPMVPIPLISDLYVKKQGTAEPTTQRQALFAFGDMGIGVQLMNSSGTDPRGIEQFEFPTPFSESEPLSKNNPSYLFQGSHLFTWDDETDRARSFSRDASLSLPAEAFYSGAGVWYWNLTAATNGSRVQPFFITRINPLWDGLGFTAKWGGSMQSVFVSPRSFAQYPYATQGVNWMTTTNVVNPGNAMTSDLSTFADLPPGTAILGLQFPGNVSLPGEVVAIRLWIIAENSGVDDTLPENMEVRFRTSWNTWLKITPDYNTATVTTPGQERGTISQSKSRYIFSFYVYERDSSAIPKGGDLTTGHYPFNTFSGELVAWNWEVGIRNRSSFNHLNVAHAALEVICKSDYRAGVDTSLVKQGRPAYHPHRRAGAAIAPGSAAPGRLAAGGGVHGPAPAIQPMPDAIKILGNTTIYATGRSALDTTPATYTATAGSVVEVPPDIARFVLDRIAGDSASTAVGTSFGSLITARTILNTRIGGGDLWRLSPIVPEISDIQQFLDEMAAQSMSFCRRQPAQTGTNYQWRWFVDGPAPHTDDAARLYRTDGFYFGPDTMALDSLAITSSDIADLYSRFTLRFGYHEPSGKFAYTMQVDKDSDNLSSSGAAYRAACLATENNYGIRRPLVIDAPWVWSETVADRLLKWHTDLRRQRRVMVEFVTGPNGLDVQEGHVIRFADDLSAWHKYPGMTGGAAWSTHNFVVTSVAIEPEALQPIRVRITALETYDAAA